MLVYHVKYAKKLWLSIIHHSSPVQGWGMAGVIWWLMKRYCFEATWYVLTPPTGGKKRCFPLPQATWEEVSGKYLENLIHVTWSLGEYRDLGSESFLRKPNQIRENTANQLHVHQLWIHVSFSQGKVYYVSKLLCNTPKVRLVNGIARWVDGWICDKSSVAKCSQGWW